MTGPSADVHAWVRLPPVTTAPGTSRRVLTCLLRAAGVADDPLDTALLLANELVTNAVVHARSDVVVEVASAAGQVRVSVSDQDPRPPRWGDGLADALSGRGLPIIDALSAAWGVIPRALGKTVWFDVDP